MSKEFARQLLALEAASAEPGKPENSRAFGVCERLRKPLGRVIGEVGFSSLLSRALALGCGDVSWLCALHANGEGSLEGVDELEATLESGAVAEGELALVGHLLGLLEIFIGPALTLRLLHDVWPSWPLKTLEEHYEEK